MENWLVNDCLSRDMVLVSNNHLSTTGRCAIKFLLRCRVKVRGGVVFARSFHVAEFTEAFSLRRRKSQIGTQLPDSPGKLL